MVENSLNKTNDVFEIKDYVYLVNSPYQKPEQLLLSFQASDLPEFQLLWLDISQTMDCDRFHLKLYFKIISLIVFQKYFYIYLDLSSVTFYFNKE